MTPGSDAPFAEFSAALLGEGLPPEAERHLRLAAENYRFGDVAEAHLLDAQTAAPGHAAVLIGLYRFYFYQGQLAQTLEIAQQCLGKAAREMGLPGDWREVRPGMARFDAYEEMAPRFFLFSLKGYAYLRMRLGDMDEGRHALQKLLELDSSDKIGAQVLLDVIARAEAAEDD
jgi:tetratricopeptide (TPR) repeat protein